MDGPVQRVKIYKEEDRLTVLTILAKNGYKVWIDKEPKSPNTKTMEYGVYFQEPEVKKC